MRNSYLYKVMAVSAVALVSMMFLGTTTIKASGGASCTWTGATDSTWSNAGNWSCTGGDLGTVVPGAADDLIFPTVTNDTSVNDLGTGIAFNTFTVTGDNYTFSGNDFSLSSGLSSTGSFFIQNNVTLTGSQTFTITGTIFLIGNLNLASYDLNTDVGPIGTAAFIGQVSGTGTITKSNAGILYMIGDNTYSGATNVNAGAISIYTGTGLGTVAAGTTIASGATVNFFTLSPAMTVAEPFVLMGGNGNVGGGALRSFDGDTTLTGNISMPTANSSGIRNDGDVAMIISGVISGTGDISFTGNIVLTNTSTYTGATIDYSSLTVNGDISASSSITLNGTQSFLRGSGTTGPVTIQSYGVIAPGDFGGTGILNTGNLDFSSPVSEHVSITINGLTAGTGYDQVKVVGTVTLNDAVLQVVPVLSNCNTNSFTILDNDGADPVNGTFNNLIEGASFTSANGASFTITYAGGDGNDIVLTCTANPLPEKFTDLGQWNAGFGGFDDLMFTGDFNGDGKGDMMIATTSINNDGTYTWKLLNGTGSDFTDGGVWNQAFGLASSTDHYYAGDFNGDGKTDILIATTRIDADGVVGNNDLAWYLMRSNGGTFLDGGQINSSYGVDSDNYYVSDFNGDGRSDMLISTIRIDANPNITDDLAWYLMRSNGSTFLDGGQINASFGIQSTTDKYYVSDFNGDGKKDMLISTTRVNTNTTLSWYLMGSTGKTFLDNGQINAVYGVDTDIYYTGDFDNDGKDDVLIGTTRVNDSNDYSWYVAGSNGAALVDKGLWKQSFGKVGDNFFINKFNAGGSRDVTSARLIPFASYQWSVMTSTY